jgi:hypothetical protein
MCTSSVGSVEFEYGCAYYGGEVWCCLVFISWWNKIRGVNSFHCLLQIYVGAKVPKLREEFGNYSYGIAITMPIYPSQVYPSALAE